MHWQYWKSSTIYAFIVVPMWLFFVLKYRISFFHIIKANPAVKYGGMQIDSKFDIHKQLQDNEFFLPQVEADKKDSVPKNIKKIEEFLKKYKTNYPIILKPKKGCVGFGVKKADNRDELEEILKIVPIDYIAQKFCDYDYEFGVFFRKYPWEKNGEVISITKKEIPCVEGDGKKNAKELVEEDRRFKYNKKNLLKYAQHLNYVPKKGEHYQVIVQGSHTYGSIFTNASHMITRKLTKSINDNVMKDFKGMYLGRFDVKVKSEEDFKNGRNIKIMEFNGCMSEPTHAYDDSTTLAYGIQEFYKVYDDVFKIARYNHRKNKTKIPYKEMIKEYRKFFKEKDNIMNTIK